MMESGKSEFQRWLQTLAIIVTIIAAAGGFLGFFWLNVPSKDDIKLLREDINRQFAEIRTDIKTLKQDYKNHLAKHNETD